MGDATAYDVDQLKRGICARPCWLEITMYRSAIITPVSLMHDTFMIIRHGCILLISTCEELFGLQPVLSLHMSVMCCVNALQCGIRMLCAMLLADWNVLDVHKSYIRMCPAS